jgi:PAS domain S-box-containing protein
MAAEMSPLKQRIGLQLFGLHAVILALAILPLAWVVSVSVNSFGIYSAKINEEQIRQQAVSSLSSLSKERGHHYEEYFRRASAVAALMGSQAGQLYDDLRIMAETSPPLVLRRQESNGMFLTPPEWPVLTAYWGDETISPQAELEMRALSRLDPLLMKSRMLLPDALATHIITVSGIGRYHTWSEAARTAVRSLPKAADFDLRDGAPLTIYTREKRPTFKAQWTNIHQDDVIDGLMVTCSAAMLDRQGELKGIVGIDIPLQTVIDDVLMGSDSSPVEHDRQLFAFLIDAEGNLIAFPKIYMAQWGLDIDFSTFRNTGDILRHNLQSSSIGEVKELATIVLGRDHLVQPLAIGGGNYLVASRTLPTFGWKYVVVSREEDLLASVQKTQAALQGTLYSLKKNFIVIAVATAGLALLLVVLAVGYFVRPLRRLATIAQRVGDGDLTTGCDLQRQDELGMLGRAMNDMIRRLARADTMRREYSLQLENDIKERTCDLQLKNRQLEDLVTKLHAESLERQKTSRAFIESERQLRSIMESSLAGLCIVQQGRFKYVNSAIAGMLGYSRSELVAALGPGDVIMPEYQERVIDRLRQREEGKFVEPLRPYNIKFWTRDGRIFDALVAEASITWEGSPASVGTIVDISELKQVEEKLRINRKRLQASLEEKRVLLREVYHRTKNNMLVIISMLSLQLDGIVDRQARKVFADTENRIRAMAMVHEALCRSENLAEINLGAYLENMARALIDTMTIDDRIGFVTQCEHVPVSIDQAVPLGLVVNELITNAVKHAFPDGRTGKIQLVLRRDGGELELIVADDGVGLPEWIDARRSQTFGLQITANMIEKQLRGSFAVDCRRGTDFAIRFSVLPAAKGDESDVGNDIDC